MGWTTKKCIKDACKETYQNLGRQLMDRTGIKPLTKELLKYEHFLFLKEYLHTDNRSMGNMVEEQFIITNKKPYNLESVREEKELNKKDELIKQAIGKKLFETPKQKDELFELMHSLGTRPKGDNLCYMNSLKYQIKLDMGKVRFPVIGNFTPERALFVVREKKKKC